MLITWLLDLCTGQQIFESHKVPSPVYVQEIDTAVVKTVLALSRSTVVETLILLNLHQGEGRVTHTSP